MDLVGNFLTGMVVEKLFLRFFSGSQDMGTLSLSNSIFAHIDICHTRLDLLVQSGPVRSSPA